jgi:signal transduction histidine kinase
MAPIADARRVRVEVSGAACVPVDSDAIARVIDNLVRNAVEASPSGGQVGVSVANGGDHVRLVVEDAGPGVPEARLVELFEPFFTTKSDGTGLGLALSRAIASAHGGTLEYRREGDATRFELSLPITEKRA